MTRILFDDLAIGGRCVVGPLRRQRKARQVHPRHVESRILLQCTLEAYPGVVEPALRKKRQTGEVVGNRTVGHALLERLGRGHRLVIFTLVQIAQDQEHVRLDDILAERNRRFELCDGTRGIAGGDLSHRQLGAQHRLVGVDLDRTLDVIRTA